MKTKLFIAGLLLLGVTAGCQDNDYKIAQSDKSIRVYAENFEPATRVTFTQDGNTTYASWDEDDRIGIYSEDQCNLEYVYSTSLDGVTEFRANGEPLNEDSEGQTVYAYYHYDFIDYDYCLPLTDPIIRWGKDGLRPFLYAQGEVQNNEVHLQFKHAFAYLKLTFTLDALKTFANSSVLTEIRLFSENMDFFDIDTKFDIKTGQFMPGKDGFPRSMSTGIDNHDLRESPYSMYIPIMPVKEGSSLCIEIATDAGEHIGFPRTVPKGGFQAGHVYTFTPSRDKILELYEEQKQALIDFYDATNGDEWYINTNWKSDKPINEWYGVNGGSGVNMSNYVIRLQLEGNTLTGTLPESFTNIMDYAETITLHDNGMSGVIPQSVRSHPRWNKFGWNIIKQNGLLGGGFDMTDINLQMKDMTVEYLDAAQGTTTFYDLLSKNQLNYIAIDTPDDDILNVHLSYHNKGFGIIVAHQPGGSESREATMERVKNHPITDITRIWHSFAESDLWGMAGLGSTYLIDNQGYLVDFRETGTQDSPAERLQNILEARLGEPEEHPIFSSDVYVSTDYSRDGEIMELQRASAGKGIDIVFIGDGYVDKDMNDGGKYETDMETSMEYLFSIEPYKSFRDRFNVYAVKVVSGTEYNIASPEKRNLRINFNNDICFEYASKISGINTDMVTIVNVVNNPNDFFISGYTNMYDTGASVAHIDVGGPSEVIIHEAGGHGFAKLLDEYIYEGYENVTATTEDKASFDSYYKSRGWGANIDFTNSPDEIQWAHLLKDERYANEVGIYEGAYLWAKGVYRPTENSVMNQDYSWFNAPSREAIYKAIMRASEGDNWTYDFEDFASYDAINRTMARSAKSLSTDKRKVIHRPPTFIKSPWQNHIVVPYR